MSPLVDYFFRLSKNSVYSAVCYARPQVICAACALSRLQRTSLSWLQRLF